MSHMAQVKTKIRDEAAILAAAKALGIPVERNTGARFFSGTSEMCDFVLKLNGWYDLGLKRQPDGTYSLIADEELIDPERYCSRSVEGTKMIGKGAGRFKQEYAYAVLQAQARRKGQRLVRQDLSNGRIRVMITGGR
jgi:hypothetical protein